MDRLTSEQFLHAIDGKTTGALRASIGLATNFADVYNTPSSRSALSTGTWKADDRPPRIKAKRTIMH